MLLVVGNYDISVFGIVYIKT